MNAILLISANNENARQLATQYENRTFKNADSLIKELSGIEYEVLTLDRFLTKFNASVIHGFASKITFEV